MNPQGAVALVTGGATRVGRVIVSVLAAEGVTVAIHYRGSAEEAKSAAAEISAAGGTAAIFQADLTIQEELDALISAVTDRFGPPNILVNSASIYRQVSMDETDRAEWDVNMALHAWAPFRLAQLMVRQLDGSPGKIINLNDAHLARPRRFAYGVSKATLSAVTRSLAGAVGPNVQVNELALGAILPPPDWSEERIQKLTADIPARRWGSPDDVARAIIALIRSDYINAETIHIDGGVTGTRK
ncbi:MAG: SDR family oxidoreductase [Chloroflexi bacterium]|nr:SDR family oxidoreductase [Chloroflexota bacterium]MCH8222813.1 SDR family oxidoreductase [Chloroflexota bacterium]